jgi:hypothetical protein
LGLEGAGMSGRKAVAVRGTSRQSSQRYVPVAQDRLSPPTKSTRATRTREAVRRQPPGPFLPERARCDFCGLVFKPFHCVQRTCVACAAKGAPDQSKLGDREYRVALTAYWRSRRGWYVGRGRA